MDDYCLNLCDISDYYCVNCKIEDFYHRIYIGSYFCSQFFLKFDITRLLNSINNQNVTLVIPIISQKNLSKGKERIASLIEYFNIDEITVNDVGMLSYISDNFRVKINLGRLFFKESRDLRYLEYINQKYILPEDIIDLQSVLVNSSISAIEIDQIATELDISKAKDKIIVHEPFCYISTGQICEFASIRKGYEEKFLKNCSCCKECQLNIITYKKMVQKTKEDVKFYKIGRAIYFLNENCKIISSQKYRRVYFPVLESVII